MLFSSFFFLNFSDTDSLDDNAVDPNDESGSTVGGKEREEEQEMYLDLYDEGPNGPGAHINHLQMVLQVYIFIIIFQY